MIAAINTFSLFSDERLGLLLRPQKFLSPLCVLTTLAVKTHPDVPPDKCQWHTSPRSPRPSPRAGKSPPAPHLRRWRGRHKETTIPCGRLSRLRGDGALLLLFFLKLHRPSLLRSLPISPTTDMPPGAKSGPGKSASCTWVATWPRPKWLLRLSDKSAATTPRDREMRPATRTVLPTGAVC